METAILILVVLNFVATISLWWKRSEDIKVEIVPIDFQSDDENGLPEPDQTEPEQEVVLTTTPAPAPVETGPWVNRKGIPWVETNQPKGPPKQEKQPGDRPYGWV